MNNRRIVRTVTEKVKQLITDQLPDLIEGVIDEVVHERVDEELSQYNSERINEILDCIHKKHGVALDILLRDAEEVCNSNICMGVVTISTTGETRRCSFKAKHNGYCKFHREQGTQIERRTLTDGDRYSQAMEDISEGLSRLRQLGLEPL